MAYITKFFTAILILFFVNKGLCKCTLGDINIGTVRTGREIGGKPEWAVTVINHCPCPQSQIKLSCRIFQSSIPINPSIFRKQGDACLLNNGNPLQPSASVTFSYAWDPPFLLLPVSAVHSC